MLVSVLGLGLWSDLGFKASSSIVRELVLSLTRLSFLLVRFRHSRDHKIVGTSCYPIGHYDVSKG